MRDAPRAVGSSLKGSERRRHCFSGLQIVRGGNQNLRAANPRGDRNHIEKLHSLIDVNWVIFLSSERRDSSTDIPRQPCNSFTGAS